MGYSESCATFPHKLGVLFEKGETPDEQTQWIKSTLAAFNINESDAQILESGDGSPTIAFKKFNDFARYKHGVVGDEPSVKEQLTLNFKSRMDLRWVSAAKAMLTALNIAFTFEINQTRLKFTFEKFSEYAMFRAAVDAGDMERIATMLHRLDSMYEQPPTKYSPEKPMVVSTSAISR